MLECKNINVKFDKKCILNNFNYIEVHLLSYYYAKKIELRLGYKDREMMK